jgi:hypothetical protein
MRAEVSVDQSQLKRIKYQFIWIDRFNVILDKVYFQERKTTRHQFQTVKYWDRLDRSSWHPHKIERPEVPVEVSELAVQLIRDQIIWGDQS